RPAGCSPSSPARSYRNGRTDAQLGSSPGLYSRGGMKLTTAGAVAWLLVFAAPTPGWAYVRGVNDQQVPLFWAATCAAVTVYPNNVVFVTSDWIYDDQALALTRHSSDSAGRIIDTDIEVNATRADMRWTTLEPGVSHPANNGIALYDLQTVLTHEFGHFIGLAHTCVGGDTAGSDSESDMAANPVDDQGQPVPTCNDATASMHPAAFASVMWFTVTA